MPPTTGHLPTMPPTAGHLPTEGAYCQSPKPPSKTANGWCLLSVQPTAARLPRLPAKHILPQIFGRPQQLVLIEFAASDRACLPACCHPILLYRGFFPGRRQLGTPQKHRRTANGWCLLILRPTAARRPSMPAKHAAAQTAGNSATPLTPRSTANGWRLLMLQPPSMPAKNATNRFYSTEDASQAASKLATPRYEF